MDTSVLLAGLYNACCDKTQNPWLWKCPAPAPADGEAKCFTTNCTRKGFGSPKGARLHFYRDHHDFNGGTPRRVRLYPGQMLKCGRKACAKTFVSLEALDAHVLETEEKYKSNKTGFVCPKLDFLALEPKVRLHCNYVYMFSY